MPKKPGRSFTNALSVTLKPSMEAALVLAKTVLQASDGTILLLKRSKTAPRRPLEWDLPGGRLDDGESFLGAAVRELEEETGMTLVEEDLTLAYTTTKMTEAGNTSWLIFVAKAPSKDVQLSAEHDEAIWVSLKEAIQRMDYKIHKDTFTYLHDNKLLA